MCGFLTRVTTMNPETPIRIDVVPPSRPVPAEPARGTESVDVPVRESLVYRVVKRAMDLALGGTILLLLIPVFPLIALMVLVVCIKLGLDLLIEPSELYELGAGGH